ncbi:Septal ring factor EnvC, activator of murein hydrolases AmiA and AmiB [Mucilaginibacter pineti]|uniref:Septal ring factor EnvC, activator of murein hydrolases AmiA and AmiB n=1 Tax=Mucilaginibacter pineti TaxID=1391627 RepID=A0A1G7KAP3_9SPHI|nr:peptidoglycan DD-metalloendopeptidase family protein [Mucilaginibacter pineti]SDF34111.1 Septal ring factor EnvC, activator of murein hydrolases AmiA and AmiB [Mucilaginibacter pineti]
MKLLKAVFLIIAVFIAVDVHAQSSAELKRRRDKLSEELEQLNKDYQETANNKKTTLKQLSILKAQINLREEKINVINSEVRNLDNQISESNNTVHSLQSQLDQLKKEYAAMVLFAYRNQSAYNKLMFLFASKDFNQAYKRLKYLQQFGTYRERQAGYIQGTQKELHVKITELDKTKQEKSTLLQDQEKEKATLGKEKNNQVKVVSDLSEHQGQLKQQQREVLAKIAKTNREIAATIRREIEEAKRKADAEAKEAARIAAAKAKAENRPAPVVAAKPVVRSESSNLNATPEAAKLSNDFLGNRGRLPWPVANGAVTQGFGMYTSPEGIKINNPGIDIRTNPGSAVRAVFDGTVVGVVDVSGTYLVMIRHGEYFTAYANLRSVSVAKGQKVTTKQILGVVATDPSTGETEAHFEVYKVSDAVNPKTWLAPN